MKEHLSERSSLTAGAHGPRPWGAIVLVLTVSSLALYAIVSAPAALRTAELVKAEQIRLEDRAHCEKFKMPPDSESFATCAADLTELRRRHRDRTVAEAAGVF